MCSRTSPWAGTASASATKPWPVSAPIRPTTSTGSATTSSISARRPRRCPSCSQPAPSRQVSARKRDQRALYEVLARIVAMALAGSGADQVQRPLRPAAVKGAAQRLAVDRYDLAVEDLGKGLGPSAEAGLEGIRVDQHEDAPEGVVRGNAIGQGQEGLQPAQLVAAVERDVVPALGARDHRAHRDDQDISQPMLDLAGTSRIREC